jgi:hypothetical protein
MLLRPFCAILAAAMLLGCASTSPSGGASKSPDVARVSRGAVRVTTDSAGRVIKAVMVEPMSPFLDKMACEFALTNWHGPPNTTNDIPISFKLDGKTPTPTP